LTELDISAILGSYKRKIKIGRLVLKKQIKPSHCFAVWNSSDLLGYVHAYTEKQAWMLIRIWAINNNYRNQFFGGELTLALNTSCSGSHTPGKLLIVANGIKKSRSFHPASDAAMLRQGKAQRASGGD